MRTIDDGTSLVLLEQLKWIAFESFGLPTTHNLLKSISQII